jgi:hypothetical protein
MTKRDSSKNQGGTINTALKEQLRPATRIGRNHWHSRKRIQMIMVPKRHDWDTIMLQGAAMKEVQERPRTATKIPINSKKWLEKKENRHPVVSTSHRKRRAKPAQVGK